MMIPGFGQCLKKKPRDAYHQVVELIKSLGHKLVSFILLVLVVEK